MSQSGFDSGNKIADSQDDMTIDPMASRFRSNAAPTKTSGAGRLQPLRNLITGIFERPKHSGDVAPHTLPLSMTKPIGRYQSIKKSNRRWSNPAHRDDDADSEQRISGRLARVEI